MRTRLLPLLPLTLAAVLLAGCTGQNAQPVGGETPDPIDTGALLVELEQVAPGFGDESSMPVADDICAAVQDGKDSDAIDEIALDGFSESTGTDVSLEQAQSAARLVTAEYCA
jgi:hypothetical protein